MALLHRQPSSLLQAFRNWMNIMGQFLFTRIANLPGWYYWQARKRIGTGDCSARESSSPVNHTWLVRPPSCTVTKPSAEVLPTEPPMMMSKARAAGVNVSHITTRREHTMNLTLTSKQKGKNKHGDETHDSGIKGSGNNAPGKPRRGS